MRYALSALVALSLIAPARAADLPSGVFEGDSLPKLPTSVFAFAPPPAQLPESAFAYSLDDEIQDVILLGDGQPTFLRMHVFVDGRGFRLTWGEFITQVHRFLDRDGDGVLNKKEYETANWQQMLMVGLFRGGVANGIATVKLDADGDGKVRLGELSNYLKVNYGPFSVQTGAGADPRSEAVFGHLDKNRDRKLSREELEAASTTLLPFDQDEDETFTLAEMGPYQSRFAQQQRRFAGGGPNNNAGLIPLNPGEVPTAAANAIINKYDKGSGPGKPAKDRKLDRAESGLSAEDFAGVDANKDGLLDTNELTAFVAKHEPDLELTVKVARDNGKGTVEMPSAQGRATALASKTRMVGDAAIDLDLDLNRAAIKVAEDRQNNGFNARDFFIQNFKGADMDGDGSVDKKEIQQNGFFNQIFALCDRDGDEKMTEPELIAYLDVNEGAGKCRTVLSIADLGRAVFDQLDENHDRRLGAREVRSAWQVLEKVDRDHDGRIVLKEIPRHLELSFGRGQTGPQFGFVDGGDDMVARSEQPGSAPLWFLQMDRNRDGDISPREFLGTPAEFTRIDLDHDGLISPAEAAKVK